MLNLLLIEDDEDSVDLMKTALDMAHLPIELLVVYDGVEAIEYLTENETRKPVKLPDLILLDLNLPRKNGRQVLTEIFSSPRLQKIPIVLLTTTEWHDDLKQLYPSLDSQCFSKPMRFQEYIDLLRSLYERNLKGDLQGVGTKSGQTEVHP